MLKHEEFGAESCYETVRLCDLVARKRGSNEARLAGEPSLAQLIRMGPARGSNKRYRTELCDSTRDDHWKRSAQWFIEARADRFGAWGAGRGARKDRVSLSMSLGHGDSLEIVSKCGTTWPRHTG